MALEYKGVNLSGLEFGNGNRPWYDYVSPGKEHYDYWAQEVGANIVRIPFSWERLQATAYGDLDQQYLGFLKTSVQNATDNGMTAILDMHNYGAYQHQPLTDSAVLGDVWVKLGKELGNNPSVWLNLMNEPNNRDAVEWKDISQDVVYALRENNIENKILLSGTAWSGAHSWVGSGNAAAYADFTDPLNNYAFDVHQYLDQYSTGSTGKAYEGIGSTSLVDITNWAQENGQKLFLGEIGAANPTLPGQELALSELQDIIEYMDSHSEAWLGFALWGAGPWWPPGYVFNINPEGIGTETPVHSGTITSLLEWFAPPLSEPTMEEMLGTAQNDVLVGTDHNDYIVGGEGKDILVGGQGNDVLYGDTAAAHDYGANTKAFSDKYAQATRMGFIGTDRNIDANATVSITFNKSDAGFRNTVGIYKIAADGKISDIQIIYADAKSVQQGAQTDIHMNGGDGIKFGMFVIANGFGMNKGFGDIDVTKLEFVYRYGKADEQTATIKQSGKEVSLVYRGDDGTVVLQGDIYHAVDQGGARQINTDGWDHVKITNSPENPSVLHIGFEDQAYGGDRDYNDIMFDVTVSSRNTSFDDTIDGGLGDDILYGGYGYDILTGGEGKDTFLYKAFSEAGDAITDFKTGMSGDVLNFKVLLDGYNITQDNIADFISVTSNNNNAIVSVREDSGSYITMAILLNVGNDVNLDTLLNGGNISV